MCMQRFIAAPGGVSFNYIMYSCPLKALKINLSSCEMIHGARTKEKPIQAEEVCIHLFYLYAIVYLCVKYCRDLPLWDSCI